jgi:hypothetical protein
LYNIWSFFCQLRKTASGPIAGQSKAQNWPKCGGYYGYKKNGGASVSTLLEYSLGIVIVQEIIFRIFLWKLGQEIFGEKSVFNVVLNTLSFAMMHIVYKGFWDNYLWLLMLFAGLIFSILYYFYPKFYLVLPIHIILNMVSVHFGIFH